MAKSKKSGKSKSAATVNFKGTDSGGRSIKDGWAVGKIVEAELTEAKESGNEMFKIVIQAKNGKQKAKVWDNLVLTPNALWKARSLLEAAGVEIDEEEDMELTVSDLLDLDEFDVEIVNEEYESRMRPRVVSFAALGTHTEEGDEDEEDEGEEDEKPSKSKKKASKKASKDDDEDEEEDEDEDEEEDDEDEDEDEPPKKAKKKAAKDEDEEEDEDEDDEPVKKGKGKSKSDDDEDEDEDEEEEEDEEEDDEDEKPKKKKGKGKAKFKAGQKVKFEDDKGRTKSGVITSIDDDTVFVEDAKGGEWELAADEIIS